MGRLPKPDRRYNLRSIQPIHKEVLRRIARGEKNKKIAEDMGVSEVMVSYTKNSITSQAQLHELQKERDEQVLKATTRVSRMADKCIDVLENVLDDPDTHVHQRIRVAQDLLNRAGVDAPKKLEAEVSGKILTADVMEIIKQRAIAAAKRCGNIVNVTAEEI